MAQSRVQAMAQQIFIARGQHGDVGNVPQIGDIKSAMVGRAIFAHKACAVYAEGNGQVLQADIVHNLIIRALQKGGIHGQRGPIALTGKARCKGHGVLFANAHIHKAVGEARAELVRAGAFGHGRRDGNDLVVMLGKFGQRIAEHRGKRGQLGCGSHRLPGFGREQADAVVQCGIFLRRAVALALLGAHMQQHRAVLNGGGHFQMAAQACDVVPVHRADVVEAKSLKQHARRKE
ncbi:hypothetical protein DSECCO2_605510 [anaerobic digester metagenome]